MSQDSIVYTASCAIVSCGRPVTQMVPGELVFGFINGQILDPTWDESFNDLLSAGGWDTWVCDDHGI